MRAPTYSSLTYWLNLLARVFFALGIILAPLRWRIVLWSRPTFPVYPDYTNFLIYASDIALIGTLGFWGLSLFLLPRKLHPGSASIWIPLIGLTLAGFVSTFGGIDPVLSWYQVIRLVLLFLFYLYIVNEIIAPAWVLVPVGLQLILQSMVAIPQSVLQNSIGLSALGELRLDPNAAGTGIVSVGGLRSLRAYGLADHPNILGGCLAFGLVLLLACIVYGKSRSRWLALTAFLPGLLALVMTFSRSAWLGFFTGSLFIVGVDAFAHKWDSVKRAVMLGCLGLLLVGPFIIKNISLFSSRVNGLDLSQDPAMQERAYLIGAGNTIFVEHSALGVGLGASPLAMKSRFPDLRTNFQPPHYTLLEVAMETGVFGATFYFLLMVLPVMLFLARWRTYAEQPIMVGAFALLLALMVVGFFDYYPWLNEAGRIWQWLAWAVWSGARARMA